MTFRLRFFLLLAVSTSLISAAEAQTISNKYHLNGPQANVDVCGSAPSTSCASVYVAKEAATTGPGTIFVNYSFTDFIEGKSYFGSGRIASDAFRSSEQAAVLNLQIDALDNRCVLIANPNLTCESRTTGTIAVRWVANGLYKRNEVGAQLFSSPGERYRFSGSVRSQSATTDATFFGVSFPTQPLGYIGRTDASIFYEAQ